MNMIKISVIAIAGVILAVQFKNGKSEFGLYISIAAGLLILAGIWTYLQEILRIFQILEQDLSMNHSYYVLVAKMLGISYLGEFTSAICRDAGYQAVANYVEMFGKIIIIAWSAPVILELLETIHGFLM